MMSYLLFGESVSKTKKNGQVVKAFVRSKVVPILTANTTNTYLDFPFPSSLYPSIYHLHLTNTPLTSTQPSKPPLKAKPALAASTPPKAPTPPPATPTPTITTATTTPPSTNPAFTPSEDSTLRTLKTSSKPWNEIEAALPGKDRGTLKKRWRELSGSDAASLNSSKTGSVKDQDKKKEEVKGKGKGKGKEAAPPVMGAVVIGGEGLDAEQMAQLYKIHTRAERDKWIEISSRFYDKTGKRVEPAVLREKLGGLV